METRKVLTKMFPLEADHLLKLEAAHSQTGVYVNSDLTAGLSIGGKIAEAAFT